MTVDTSPEALAVQMKAERDAAIASEREACAKLCEMAGDTKEGHSIGYRSAAWELAARIRSRGRTMSNDVQRFVVVGTGDGGLVELVEWDGSEECLFCNHELDTEFVLASDYDALLAERDAAVKDAERYRWLRHGDNDELVLKQSMTTGIWYLPRMETLDTAIDAARSESALDRMADDAREKGLDDWTEGEK